MASDIHKKKQSCYPALEAEIARQEVLKRDIAEQLHITPRALSKKLVGESRFKESEKTAIHSIFPDLPLDKLFAKREVNKSGN